jgi:hypothetical protein
MTMEAYRAPKADALLMSMTNTVMKMMDRTGRSDALLIRRTRSIAKNIRYLHSPPLIKIISDSM